MRSPFHTGGVVLVLLIWFLSDRLTAGPTLPIYLEDCHAGSFYWLADTLDLDQPYVLLHFDAHSDANAVFGSDNVRDALRKVTSLDERTRRLNSWRKIGAVQCFDWIEPLMPRPFEHVIWVPAETLAPGDQAARQTEARAYLDGHEEVAPRACGSLAEHYEVCSFERLRTNPPGCLAGGLPIVASVDLDYFAALPDAQLPGAFERLFSYLLTLDRLQAITFAISSPYLKDQSQAQRLVELALTASLSVDNANVRFEPFARTGLDRSRAMRIFAAQGKPLPIYDLTAAPPDLRALCVQQRDRLRVETDADSWQQLLDGWAEDLRLWRIGVSAEGGQGPDSDGVWRLPEQSDFSVGFAPASASGSGRVRVRWLVSQTISAAYNVVEPHGENAFAAHASRFIRRAPQLIREDETLDKPLGSAELRPFFDPVTGLGNLRLYAEVEREDGSRIVTNTLSLCRTEGVGFLRALSTQFNRPYVYGSGLVRDDHDSTGPDTGMGADCTNFLVAGLRGEGWQLPWGNPAQFRRFLEPVTPHDLRIGTDQRVHDGPKDIVRLDAGDAAKGLFLDFGTHMAALWEDREPRGVLDGNDLVVHQLEGRPEVLPLRELLGRRSSPAFRLERLRPVPVTCRLMFGGDVMLARRTEAGEARATQSVPVALAKLLRGVDLAVVNLECAVTDRGEAVPHKTYTFRALPEAVQTLQAMGVGAVSVANNHSGDFGRAGFLDMLTRLDQGGRCYFGGGRTCAEAYQARMVNVGPLKIALVGYSDADTRLLPAREPDGGIAVTDEWPAVLAEVRTARKDGADFVAVMPHWGQENSSEIEDRQRQQAHELIEAGADLVAGNGPHRVQAQEEVDGQPVVYSLGNLVYDAGRATAEWWSHGELLEVSLGEKGRILRAETIPVPQAADDRVPDSVQNP